jgi:bacillithiol biosynthesis cysteine-adding enzyme BshC
MAKVKGIPFRGIPHQSNLFLSYLDLSPAALHFYRYPPTMEGLERAASDTQAVGHFPRKAMASVLRRQNTMFGGDSETLRRIDELEKPDSVAVLTGQQVGLFTGPLYTIYKALTAVRMAEELKERGITAVPIFWMDTEDHDLAEVTRCAVLDSHSSVRIIDYGTPLCEKVENRMCSVGSLRLPESIRQIVSDYVSHLPDYRWKLQVQSQLELAYRPGASLALSFAQLMLQILRGTGLILYDPQDVEAKQLMSDLFQKALLNAADIHAALYQRNHELSAAGFHPQVSVMDNSTVLFFLADGERRALERHNHGFRLRNSDRSFSRTELLDCAKHTPERFSPNVLLRPLVQDHLFPTVVYLGGPSELAYFAQIEVLYGMFERPMPVVWPRNSYTLLEPEVGAELDRLNLEIQDCFRGEQDLIEKAIRNSCISGIPEKLETLQTHLDQGLTGIRPELQVVDPPLVQALENAKRKILHNVRHLKSRAVRLEGKHNSSVSNAVQLLINHCFPNRNLQERELGILGFFARHGPPIVDTIRSVTEPEDFAHRVLRLEDTK